MAILAGIDEAGLGPLLGPLVVSGVAFRVPDEQLDHCLWQTLRESCTSDVRRPGRRLVVADSKKLHRPRAGLGPIERTALVMLAVEGERPASWRALLDRLAPGASAQLDRYPWYSGVDLPLPTDPAVGDVATRANAVQRDCHNNGIKMHDVFSEPLPAGHYNRLVSSTRNKAVVLMGLMLRVVDRIARSAPGQRLRICIDRLGGRTHYREAIMTAMPGCELRIIEESAMRSAYRVVRTTRTCDIEFVTGGDRRHFAVALASIYSKYLRELYMRAFNAYWSTQTPSLKPTAGYYTDAKRWLGDLFAVHDRKSLDLDALVRQR